MYRAYLLASLEALFNHHDVAYQSLANTMKPKLVMSSARQRKVKGFSGFGPDVLVDTEVGTYCPV